MTRCATVRYRPGGLVMGVLHCRCGREHADTSSLVKRGWQSDGHGSAVLLVNCRCGSTLAADFATDASVCEGCRRLVVGSGGDVKVASNRDGKHAVYCMACARRRLGLPGPARGGRGQKTREGATCGGVGTTQ